MDKTVLAILVAVLLSALGALADYFLKLASGEEQIVCNKWFAVALVIYSSTIFGWVFVVKSMKLASVGVVYSICMVLFLSFTGIVFFKERLSYPEVIGIGLALASLTLLARFAE
jgi:drug/metabolite transporter (DMT)-like permease